MSTETRKIEWMSQAGQPIVVTVTVRRDLVAESLWLDGDRCDGPVKLIESTRLVATVDGEIKGDSMWIGEAPKGAPPQVVGVIGRVALRAEIKAEIESAIAEAMSAVTTPEINTYLANRAARVAESERAEAACRRYSRMIRLQEGE